MYIQFAFALIILRWEVGFQAFKWLGDRIQEFLAHTDAGAIFVFGDSYMNHFFAFKVSLNKSERYLYILSYLPRISLLDTPFMNLICLQTLSYQTTIAQNEN